MNILLVDDHGIFREGTALLLKSLDPAIEVAHARTTRECLDNAATMNFDLVLLDLGLPDKPGLEALSDLKHAHPDLPVVVLSGHEERQARLHAGRAGWNLNGDRICRRAAGADRERAGRGHLCLGKC